MITESVLRHTRDALVGGEKNGADSYFLQYLLKLQHRIALKGLEEDRIPTGGETVSDLLLHELI